MENVVLITDHVHESIPLYLSGMGFIVEIMPDISNDALGKVAGKYTGLIISTRTIINSTLLDKADKLLFIGRVGSGMEHVDRKACEEHGVMCFSSPEGNANAVGEHCLGLLLAVLNNIVRSDREIREGKWEREENRGEELDGKVVGIIGFGHTGPAFAKKLKGFETEILVYDKYKEIISNEYWKTVTLENIQQQADIISFHVPYTSETHHMFCTAFLEKCSKPVIILNTSRGAIMHTPDLLTGLRNGRIQGLGLDVFEDEPIFSEKVQPPSIYRSLLEQQHVVVSPHIAGWTHQSKSKLSEILMEKIGAWWSEKKEMLDKK